MQPSRTSSERRFIVAAVNVSERIGDRRRRYVTFLTPVNIAGDTDVSTTGTYFDAATFFAGGTTVNGVIFNAVTTTHPQIGGSLSTDASGDISIAQTDFNSPGSYATPKTPGAGFSQNYVNLLTTIGYGEGSDTITISNLTPFAMYQVQGFSYYDGDGMTATTNYGGIDTVDLINT